MAKAFCIPKNIAEQLKASVRNGDWNMQTLWDMTSKQRHELFMKYVDDATALRMNAGFEQAMISEQQNALVKWAERVFIGQDEKTKSTKKDVIDKIKELNEIGYIKASINRDGNIEADDATKIFLSDLVEEKLGVSISEEEMKTITEKTKILEKYEQDRDEFGLPTDDYFKARRDLDNYILSLAPSNVVKILTGTIGRGNMLFNLSSAIVNVTSNTVQAIEQFAEKRIARLLLGRNISSLDSIKKYGDGYKKRSREIYKKYRYDVTRILSLSSDTKTLGEVRETHSEGKGNIRKIARFYEDLVFTKLLGYPDVVYSSIAFTDTLQLWSTEIARSEKLEGEMLNKRALEIMKDATKIEPETLDGRKVREAAIVDAQHATFTDKRVLSTMGLGIRNLIDAATGDLQLGTQVVPFMKTPANVIAKSVEMGGIGFVQGFAMLPNAIKDVQSGDIEKADYAIRKIVSAGLGFTFAYILASMFEPEDFIGAYPTNAKERQLMNEKGAMPNSIKIKGKWRQIDYLAGIGTPFLGIMYARKYEGKDITGKVFAYLNGAKATMTNFPGLEEISTLTSDLSSGEKLKYDPEKFKDNLISGSLDYLRARLIPSAVSQFAKMTDEYERDVYAERDPFAKLKSNIPVLRQTLPVKKNVFGEEIRTEAAWSTLLFGSRLKTAKKGELLDEIVRLDETGNAPSITNSEWTSPRVVKMKKWLSADDYKAMISLYQKEWVENSLKMISSKKYQEMAADQQSNELTKIKDKALEEALDKYNYDELEKRNEK
jgi:hypothetical protein